MEDLEVKCSNDGLRGNITVISNFTCSSNYVLEFDTFVFLLNNQHVISDDSDVLYYNSKLNEILDCPGGQTTVPISRDRSVWGPMSEYEHELYTNINLEKVGLTGNDCYDAVDINLDLVDKSIAEIVFVHNEYSTITGNKINEKIENLVLDNFIVGMPSSNLISKNTLMIDVSNSYCFLSGKLVRNTNGTWSYVSCLEYKASLEDYFNLYA